jgi:sugar phosphate isomerase/epimerase
MELTNFTVWGREWFTDGWEGLRRFCAAHGLAGVELLANGAAEDCAPPRELIQGVHLRSLGSWLPLVGTHVPNYGHGGERYAQVRSYRELVAARLAELQEVAVFGPEYVIWHATYTPVPQVFGGPVQLDNATFLAHLAELVADVCERWKPPFRICFENAWGVGLEFDPAEVAAGFLQSLDGLPVGLALDIGHHLHTRPHLSTPEQACEELRRLAAGLQSAGIAVEVLHLHWTPPALKPAMLPDAEAAPADADVFFPQQDQHRPLESPALEGAVAALAPRIVVHEMGAMSLAEHDEWLRRQRKALHASADAGGS